MEDFHISGPFRDSDKVLPIHIHRPGHNTHLQRQHHKMQERISDSEEDDDSDYDHFDPDEKPLTLHPTKGQNVALWSFAKQDSIAVFDTDRNLVNNVIEYAEKHLGFQRFQHRLMVLTPGHLTPIPLKSVFTIRPGSVVMVLPQENARITIEISQLKTKLILDIDLSWTVRKIKSLVKRQKGIPVERQEILYLNKALENDRRLFEYRIKLNTTIYVMIQAHFDLLINIETFWGKKYRFYLDPCSTGMDIIYTVFNRCFSSQGPEDAGLHELYVPMHVLMLQYENKIVNWDFCIAYLGIHTGERLTLTTVVHQSNMQNQTVNVISETGEKYSVTVSPYDRWSILAFMLHGITNIPVDLIRLFNDGKRVDFSTPIGILEHNHTVTMNVVMTHMDHDLIFGVPVKVSIGNGIIENVRIAANKTVKGLKRKLEKMGVPNASFYELTIGNQKLPNNMKLMNAILDLEIPLSLKLETYPVFAHAPDGVIYKTYLKVNQTISSFKSKIESKTGYPLKHSRLFMSGNEIKDHSETILYESGVSCRNSIFFLPSQDLETFSILGNRWLDKIRITNNPTAEEIRQTVWNAWKVSESSLNCILTILYWYFMPRIAEASRSNVKLKIRKRLPIAREALYEIKNLGKLHLMEKDKKEKIKPRVIKSSPTPGEKPKQRPSPRVYHQGKRSHLPKFENGQYIDQNVRPNSADTTLPNMYDSPRSRIPAWMKNIQTRTTANRLNIASLDDGPYGMNNVHQSSVQKLREKKKTKLKENGPLHQSVDHSHPTHVHKESVKQKRFQYNYQLFDYINSDNGTGNQSDSAFSHNFLPKI